MLECTPFVAFKSFSSAALGMMNLLQQRMPMLLWMVSRVQSEHFIILETKSMIPLDQPQPVIPGSVLPWNATICHQLIAGLGPIIAPDLSAVPAYRECPVAQMYGLAAYVGVPLLKEDGALFGTLCGVSQHTLPAVTANDKALLETLARMLSTVLSQELRAEENAREADRAKAEAMRDGPTGLFNRRAMQKLMDAEENRCRRYGHNAAVVVIDLNGLKSVNDQQGHAAGDDMIRRAASAIKAAARDSDLVGRVGGDEFVLLALECDETGGDALAQRVRDNLTAAGLSAGLGVAARQIDQTLYHAMDQADQRMYADKRRGKAAIVVPLGYDRAAA